MKKKLSQFLSLLIAAALVITCLPINVLAETVTNTNGEGITIDLSATDESLDEVLSNISGLNALANDANGTSSTAKNPEKVADSKKDSVEKEEDTKEEIKFDSGSGVESPATDFEYTITDSQVTIDEYIGSATEVVIPAEIEGYPVTNIGDYAFYNCSSLTSITIPDSVTSIGDSAFEGCSALTSITLPEGLTSIGNSTFYRCSALTSITIPEGVTSIGSYAFSKCSALTSITLPEGVTSIGYSAFSDCSSLTSITLPEGLMSIGDYAFYCSALTSITLPEGVTSIGEWTFACCDSLTSITLPEGVTSIGDFAFEGCSSLTSITLPEGVTSIGEWTFACCDSLTSITLPEGVTSIGDSAFYVCSALTSITIPGRITSIGSDAFRACYKLKHIYYTDTETKWNNIGILYGNEDLTKACIHYEVTPGSEFTTITHEAMCTINNKNVVQYCNYCSFAFESAAETATATGHNYVNGVCENCGLSEDFPLSYEYNNGTIKITDCNESATKVTIPSTIEGYKVTSIGDYAFSDCRSLTSITIPGGVTSIGNFAFFDCRSLTSITIPEGVTSIGGSAFEECYSLTSITIPGGVTSIGNSAFFDCRSLTSITIPEGVTSIGDYVFYRCSALTNIIIPEGVTSIGGSAFEECYSLTSIIIPDSVTSIGDDAFYACVSLTSVTIPASVESMGLNVFRQCPSMTGIEVSINNKHYSSEDGVLFNKKKTELICCPGGKKGQYVIPDSVTSVWKYAFMACFYLTSVTIPNSVTSIGYKAFENCESLTSVTIPDSVKTIEENTFAFCYSLTSVIIENGVSSIENHAFYTCESLTNVIIGNSVTSIGYNAFAYCHSLESVTIPDSVTSLEGGAFDGCSSLTNVTIGNGVTSIGFNAFNKCESLTSITIPNNVTNIEKSAFAYCSSLTRVTMGNGINSIGELVFNKCTSLTSVTIPESVASVINDAFSGCSSLISIEVSNNNKYYSSEDGVLFNKEKTELIRCPEGKAGHYVIPDTVTCIRENSFSNCDKITRLTIGNCVKNIVSDTFYDCDSLVSLTLSRSIVNIEYDAFSRYGKSIKHIFYTGSEAEWNNISISSGANLGSAVVHYEAVPGNEYEVKVQNATCTTHKNTSYCCAYCEKTIFEFEEPNSAIGHHYVDGICEYCNIEEGRLWNYKISKGNAYITEGESSVKEVTIPPEIEGFPVKGIEWFSFQDCTELTKVTILANIDYISLQAFCGCSKLESIYIPNSISIIESNAFYKCSALKNVYYGGTEDEWKNINIKDGNDELLNANIRVNCVPSDITEETNPSVDSEVSTDFEYSFKYSKVTINKYLGTTTEVVIPSEIEGCPVTSIGDQAFRFCSELTSIKIPESVTSIGGGAFDYCSSLTSITIPDNVTSIGSFAFSNCRSLTSITIPERVTSIGYGAFDGCWALKRITIPDSVTSIGGEAFRDCSALISIRIPDGVTSIDYRAFFECESLTSISIPDSVTTIGEGAFAWCSSLTKVIITGNVTSIDDGAFDSCKSLADVYYTGTEAEWNAIEIGSNNDSLNNATIHFNYDSAAIPTVEPTSEPTGQPTVAPTSAPTAQPTAEPTDSKNVLHVSYDEVRPGIICGVDNANIKTPALETGTTEATFWGWVALAKNVKSFSYSINGGAKVNQPSAVVEAEQPVLDAAAGVIGAITASRFKVIVPVTEGIQKIEIFAEFEDGTSESFWVADLTVGEPTETVVYPCIQTSHNAYTITTVIAPTGYYLQSVTLDKTWVGIVFPGWALNNDGTATFEVFAYNTDLATSAAGTALLRETISIKEIPKNEHRFAISLPAGKYVFKISNLGGTGPHFGIGDKASDVESSIFINEVAVREPFDPAIHALIMNYIVSDISADKPNDNTENLTPSAGSNAVVDSNKAIVSGIAAESKPADVIAQFKGSENIQIVSKDGKLLADDALVGTGCKVQLIESGEVKDEVTVVIKGEIDGNGKIDSDDAIYLLRNTLFASLYPVVAEDDVDGNGEYNSDDAIHLLRHTLFPSMYPLK